MEVVFYKTEDGKIPVKDFLYSLNKNMQSKAIWTIKCLEAEGQYIREPYSKNLEDGIFELRIKNGSDISRILYFFFIGDKAVLTNGFVKKTQKTPKKEIERAKAYKKDFIRRSIWPVTLSKNGKRKH